jgi:hypothetical protein
VSTADGAGVGGSLAPLERPQYRADIDGLRAIAVLIGTWASASWAIGFYERNGFTVVPDGDKDRLLRTYWSIPARQIETSVVLADGRWMQAQTH